MRQASGTPYAMPPTAAGGIARLAVARLIANGIDASSIVRLAGLTPSQIEDPHTRIPVEAQIALLNLAADAIQDDVIGFHLAEGCELREAGLLYFVLASSATLGEAMARAERYSTITNDGIVLQCLHGNELCIRFSYAGVPRHTDRHQIEFWVTALVRICQRLSDSDVRPIRIHLAHPRCAASARLDEHFGSRVTFAAERDEVAFARGASQLRLKDAEPHLSELLVRYGDEALSRRANPVNPLRASVENAIAPLLPHGKARVDEVARVLGMSRRTLARRLAAEDLTFVGILEELRKGLALHYLKDANLSVSRIAWLLGFQEVSAFTHAFKRWTGQTPTRMRLRNRTGCEATAENAECQVLDTSPS
jgi:AraC-like DNA-binding protein